MNSIVKKHLEGHLSLIENNLDDISLISQKIANELKRVLKNNRTIFLAGNGGSAADCEHIAGELVGRYKKIEIPIRQFP